MKCRQMFDLDCYNKDADPIICHSAGLEVQYYPYSTSRIVLGNIVAIETLSASSVVLCEACRDHIRGSPETNKVKSGWAVLSQLISPDDILSMIKGLGEIYKCSPMPFSQAKLKAFSDLELGQDRRKVFSQTSLCFIVSRTGITGPRPLPLIT